MPNNIDYAPMQEFKGSPWILLIYSSFVAISSILILGGMFLSPSEPDSAVLMGLSLPRLTLAAGLLTLFIFFTSITIKASRNRAWAERTLEMWFGESRLSRVIAWLAAISFGLGWIGCFLPSDRAGILAVHWMRIRPAMIFILLASIATLAMIIIRRGNFTVQNLKISKTYKVGFILFFISLLIIGLMLNSGFGVHSLEDYWYGAGVPILVPQLIAAILGGIFFLWIEKKSTSRHFDLMVCLLIFAVTAILWALEPLQKSFMFVGPYAPNQVLYPFADSALFDTASQFALIGQKFLTFNGLFFERSLYISFLVYLHSLAGQDYVQLMAIQAGIFAVFPVLVYLVGRSLNISAVGFAAAIIATLRGMNSIAASNMIDMASPKMMLTDFPTAIGMALIVLLICEWLKRPHQKWHYAIWIGGTIGLTIMLRTNTLLFLLLIPIYTFLRFSPAWKSWLVSSMLLILAVFAVTLPWELRNQSLGGQIYSSFFTKFQNVIEQRYKPPAQPGSSIPREDGLPSISFKNTQILLALYKDADIIQEPSCNTAACFVPNHFLHNIVTSILILPTSPLMEDLRHTVKESYPYWDPRWDGSLTDSSLLFFALNIFFIALGMGVAWKEQHLAGLAPLAIFMFYNLSNGLARTSGGRYIVPIDWIISVYFLIGVFHVITSFAGLMNVRWALSSEPRHPDSPKHSFTPNDLSKAVSILAILFGLGTLIPLSENLYSNRYQGFDITKTLMQHEQNIARAGLTLDQINTFLENPSAEILVGRTLYPRHYIENEGEVHFFPYVDMGFPRTTFTLIGPQGEQGIVVPGDRPKRFPHGMDAIVLGCREQFYVDALAVIILDEKGSIHTRSPESDLQCPLKQPVCDNNHNCN